MSEENVEVARRWVELFNDPGDVNEFLSLLDPAVEMQTPGGPRLRGHAEVRSWYEDDYEYVRPRILPKRYVGGGDIVVGLGELELTWVESGETIRQGESAGFWFREGKIARWQPFETHAEALEAAGLRE
jgi:SnoaL-like domain